MICQVHHTTTYTYPGTVSVCHNAVYLRPRDSAQQRCLSYELVVLPEPGVCSQYVDFFGNAVTFFAVQEPYRTLTVTDRAASAATVVAKVLGAKTLTVKAAKSRVKRRGSVGVVVTGLAPGELIKVTFRGRTIATGKASSTGRYVATVKVGRRLGKATIRAYGQFPLIRKGATEIRVVR